MPEARRIACAPECCLETSDELAAIVRPLPPARRRKRLMSHRGKRNSIIEAPLERLRDRLGIAGRDHNAVVQLDLIRVAGLPTPHDGHYVSRAYRDKLSDAVRQ